MSGCSERCQADPGMIWSYFELVGEVRDKCELFPEISITFTSRAIENKDYISGFVRAG